MASHGLAQTGKRQIIKQETPAGSNDRRLMERHQIPKRPDADVQFFGDLVAGPECHGTTAAGKGGSGGTA